MLQLFDATGRKAADIALNGDRSFDTHAFGEGIYFMMIRDLQGTFSFSVNDWSLADREHPSSTTRSRDRSRGRVVEHFLSGRRDEARGSGLVDLHRGHGERSAQGLVVEK